LGRMSLFALASQERATPVALSGIWNEVVEVRNYVVVLLVAALLWTPCAAAQAEGRKPALMARDITVTVWDHKGHPVPGARVQLFKTDGTAVASLVTDEKGRCQLKKLIPRPYRLVVADRAIEQFAVSDKAKLGTLLVVLPAPGKRVTAKSTTAKAPGAGLKTAALSQSSKLLIFIIGGVAVAGCGLVVANRRGDGHGGDGRRAGAGEHGSPTRP